MCKRKINYNFIIIVSFSLLFGVGTKDVVAVGEMIVAPTRVVFDGRRRSSKVNLVNIGKEMATFRLSFVQKRMTDTGKFEKVKEKLAGEQFSNNMVRFSPRQVTLQPGQSQVIRLILRKPSNLTDGEYRSHLLFLPIPDRKSASIVKKGQLGVSIKTIIGISIPVIVRHGKTTANIEINDIKFIQKDKINELSFRLDRTGNRSVYGDFTVNYITNSGEKYVVKKANGMSVYSPNKSRQIIFPIQAPPNIEFMKGKIEINYHEKKIKGGSLISRGEVKIP